MATTTGPRDKGTLPYMLACTVKSSLGSGQHPTSEREEDEPELVVLPELSWLA
jgi:hypothetical protein